MTTRLGYACINSTIRKDVSCNKTCRLATVLERGTDFPKGSPEGSLEIYNFLCDYGRKNLEAMYKIISWSKNHNIFFYRMSSTMLPHISNERVKEYMTEEHWLSYFTLDFVQDLIYDIGKYVQKWGIRLSMHPGHYNQLGTPTTEVLNNTFTDLYWQARLLDLLEKGAEAYIQYKGEGINVIKTGGTLCLHLGGTYGNKKEAIRRWKKAFHKLPQNIQNRVCIENCEKGYSVEDALPVCEELGIPLIFDFHHYNCWANYHPENPDQADISKLMPRILATWKDRIPKFHLSDQAEDKKVGAHHDYVENIPDELLALLSKVDFDIMIEAKAKELAVQKLQAKYKDVLC